MMPQQTTSAELAALRAELDKPAVVSSRPAAAAAELPLSASPPRERSESEVQVEHFLQELQSALDDVAANTEDLIAEHPLPAVSAAFLLGVAVGWVAARR
jgi:ElaB/YqjD/DUF883 family membrane-anchored ribosome-binding protein